jgi:TonB-linked SusC/RagA family outer membrane protein
MSKFLITCFAAVFALYAYAQEKTVTGKVTSLADGSPLPGVNLVVKGTNKGTVTEADGNYSVSVTDANSTLVFSFIGFQTLEVAVGERTIVDVQLALDVKQLSEVVVTAQGIQRERKALGYASTTIASTDLANKPETDVGRALQGRTPGLQILNSSGLAGSGTKINIRGISSVSGNTQPLWVVDGVPINTSTNDSNTDFRDGMVAPNRFIDIDPNNIESINILRGLSATTLYGSLGRNGVILVTTKAGSSNKQLNKFEASVSQSYFVVEAIVPEFQNKWANGFDGDYGEFFSNWGRVFSDQTPPGPPHPYFEHRNLFPEITEFNQPGNTAAAPNQATYVPKAYPNNVKDFFTKGSAVNTSINLGMRTEAASVNFNYSHLDESGFIENNRIKRDNIALGGTTKLTNKLTLSSVFNFVRTDFKTPPTGAGQGSNSVGGPSVFASLFYVPRNIDLMGWPYENPNTHSSIYYRNGNDITNPRWLLYNSQQTSLTNRFFSNISFNYDITDWMKVSYRLGYDTYSEKQTYWLNKGSVGYPSDIGLLSNGLYRSVTANNSIIDHTLMGTVQRDISNDIDFTGIVGFNSRTDNYEQSGLESSGQAKYGLIEHRNFAATTSRDFRGNNLNSISSRTWVGTYFDAGFGFKNFLYLNVTGRNDWASTHEKKYRSLFYPGVSASFIPTVAFPELASNVLDFLKVRMAYGTSANFADPYNTRPYLAVNSQASQDVLGNVITMSVPIILANPDLKPELQSELEFGIESQVLDSRGKIDLSIYRRLAKDQIIDRTLDPSTGYNSTLINAGEISNRGVEMGLTVTPIKRKNGLTWDLRANFTKNVSKVESLPEGSKEILISGFTNLGNFAVEGQPFNVIKGTYVNRNENGDFLVTENGDWSISDDIGIIGDPNPKWLGSLISTLQYKGITFGFQWDYVHGGQVFSYTATTMIGRGVAKDLEDFDPGLPLVLPGVKEEDGSPNDMPITTSGAFFSNTILGGGASDRGIFDATRIRFREISLGYDLPANILSKVKLRGANISLVGNNLWYRAINAPKYAKADFDRTAFGVGNGSGFDFLGGPSAKRYGVNLRLTF